MIAALLALIAMLAAPDASTVRLVRAWLGPASARDPQAPIFPGARELAEASDGYREVEPLLRRNCELGELSRPPEVAGTLFEADLDGDGAPERFFAGGCAEDHFFIAFKKGGEHWSRWIEGEGNLVRIERGETGVVFISLQDGNGIEREQALHLQRVGASGAATTPEFRAVGEQAASTAPLSSEECRVDRTAKLRYEPRVRDAPEDSGMGFDYPGNLVQVLAAGSRGQLLGRSGRWRWCAFASPPETANPGKQMRKPIRLTLDPEAKTFIVGWLL